MDNCPICYEALTEWTPAEECGHVFHDECIKKWVRRRPNCPMCRMYLRERQWTTEGVGYTPVWYGGLSLHSFAIVREFQGYNEIGMRIALNTFNQGGRGALITATGNDIVFHMRTPSGEMMNATALIVWIDWEAYTIDICNYTGLEPPDFGTVVSNVVNSE